MRDISCSYLVQSLLIIRVEYPFLPQGYAFIKVLKMHTCIIYTQHFWILFFMYSVWPLRPMGLLCKTWICERSNRFCYWFSRDKLGKEFITLYDTQSMETGSLFYTDANGREILERRYVLSILQISIKEKHILVILRNANVDFVILQKRSQKYLEF